MIQPSSTAPVGSVATLLSYSPSDFPLGSAVLCRNTAPLVALAFGFIARDRGVRVLGRDIGTGLSAAVKKTKATTVPDLKARLFDAETKELKAAKTEARRDVVTDRYRCLAIFCNNASSVDQVLSRIDGLFGEENASLLTLSTIHKAKGLEWPTIFILDWNLLPSKWATTDAARAQERNLQYVAVTRAKLDLRFIRSDSWRK